MSTACKPVTLVVVTHKNETARFLIDKDQADRAMTYSRQGLSALFGGIDVNGNSFTVDVGCAAREVYIEE